MVGAHEASVRAARQASAAFWRTAESLRDAQVTIALRLPILWQAAMDPFAWPARAEAQRAAVEKWEAGVEGTLAAMGASAALWRAMILRPGDMQAFARGMEAMQKAALAPARKRVRGNAKRLSRG